MSVSLCVYLDVFSNVFPQHEITLKNTLSDALQGLGGEFQVQKADSLGLKENERGKLIFSTFKNQSNGCEPLADDDQVKWNTKLPQLKRT